MNRRSSLNMSISLLPESVRWQISMKRYDQAQKTLQKISLANKRPLSGPVFTSECREGMVKRNGYQVFTYLLKLFITVYWVNSVELYLALNIFDISES